MDRNLRIRPKVAPDNTISIYPIKESWNREEVIELIKKFNNDLEYSGRWETMSIKFNIENWIKENL